MPITRATGKCSGSNSVTIIPTHKQGQMWNPKQENSCIFSSVGRWKGCILLLISVNTDNVQLKNPNKDSALQIILLNVLKHHACQPIKAEGTAGDWVCFMSPGL